MALFFLPNASPVIAGESLPGAKLTFYETGTSTVATVYADGGLTTPHASPVVADANGVFAPIYVDDSTSYRVVLTTAANELLSDVEPFIPVAIPDIIPRYAQTEDESEADVTPFDTTYPPGDVRRYGAVGDGVTNDTAALQAAIDVASVDPLHGGSVEIPSGSYLVDTLTFDSHGLHIRGQGASTRLIASTSIPASGAILLSLAGGADASTNQALVDAIYGADVEDVRTAAANSLENVAIENIAFVGGVNAIRGIWVSGFTRGCRIAGCYFNGCNDVAVAVNGSWSFMLLGNHVESDSLGTGFGLGQSGFGERAGSSVVNAPTIIGNEVTGCANGCIWNFGAGGTVNGNIFEFNTGDGFRSNSVDAVTFTGNYCESNSGTNLRLGGTNGTDFCRGWIVQGNQFSNNTGDENITLQGMIDCKVGPNAFGGTQTKHYFIAVGIGQYISGCDVWVPEITATYIGNASEFDTEANWVNVTADTEYRIITPRLSVVEELKTNTGSSIGFFGATPITKPVVTGAHSSNAALVSLLEKLELLGLINDNSS